DVLPSVRISDTKSEPIIQRQSRFRLPFSAVPARADRIRPNAAAKRTELSLLHSLFRPFQSHESPRSVKV
ncbi:hypothetical protein PFISCL1PPCAC_448, partial [Pristionchus fissidentatus]